MVLIQCSSDSTRMKSEMKFGEDKMKSPSVEGQTIENESCLGRCIDGISRTSRISDGSLRRSHSESTMLHFLLIVTQIPPCVPLQNVKN